MNTGDVKNLAKKTGRTAETLIDGASALKRAQTILQHADETMREFAKSKPVMATAVAAAAGYLLGRAVARAT